MMHNIIDSEIIKSENDVFLMLDELFERRENEWWDEFYSKKERPIPFFKNIPDENLVSYVKNGIFRKGCILDVGCGNGRNSIYLAKQGFDVDAIDFSKTSIDWAKKWSNENHVHINFVCDSIFNYKAQPISYDYIYDSGCLHHIKPHKRNQYLEIILNLLKPNGYLGLVCFNKKGGANISDYDAYRNYSMKGGLAFTENKLRVVLETYFEVIEIREMQESLNDDLFGKDFLWSVLLKKK